MPGLPTCVRSDRHSCGRCIHAMLRTHTARHTLTGCVYTGCVHTAGIWRVHAAESALMAAAVSALRNREARAAYNSWLWWLEARKASAEKMRAAIAAMVFPQGRAAGRRASSLRHPRRSLGWRQDAGGAQLLVRGEGAHRDIAPRRRPLGEPARGALFRQDARVRARAAAAAIPSPPDAAPAARRLLAQVARRQRWPPQACGLRARDSEPARAARREHVGGDGCAAPAAQGNHGHACRPVQAPLAQSVEGRHMVQTKAGLAAADAAGSDAANSSDDVAAGV